MPIIMWHDKRVLIAVSNIIGKHHKSIARNCSHETCLNVVREQHTRKRQQYNLIHFECGTKTQNNKHENGNGHRIFVHRNQGLLNEYTLCIFHRFHSPSSHRRSLCLTETVLDGAIFLCVIAVLWYISKRLFVERMCGQNDEPKRVNNV